MTKLVSILSIIVLFSCSSTPSIPPELAASNQVQDIAISRAEQARVIVIEAYDRELRRAYEDQISLVMNYELLKAQANGSVPVEVVAELQAQATLQRQKFSDELDRKKGEFLSDPNLSIARSLNQAEGRWVMMVDESARRFQEILEAGKGLFDKQE